MASENKQEMAVQLKSYWTGINYYKKEEDKLHTEYFSAFGTKMISSKSNTMITNAYKSTIDGWNTAYGTIDIIPRKNRTYFWSIAIAQHNSEYSSVVVGIDESVCQHCNTYFHGQTDTVNYGYKSNGKKYSKTTKIGFSDPYNAGDIVFMMIKGYTLSFSKISLEICQKKNIKSLDEYLKYGGWIVAEKRIDSNKIYKMAVSLYGKTTMFGSEDKHMSCVELLKYQLVTTQDDDDYDQSDRDEYDTVQLQLYDDEKKHGGEIDSDRLKLKTNLISLQQQLIGFERKYNKKALSVQFEKTPQTLLVSDDINTLKTRLRSFSQHLNKIEQHISGLVNPDVTKYKMWNIGQMIQWISLLDNGAYINYLSVLRRGFKSDNICSGAQLCQLQRDDLRCSPFNIKDFAVRRKLARHFKSLTENTAKMHSFYGQNAYNPNYNANPPSAPYN